MLNSVAIYHNYIKIPDKVVRMPTAGDEGYEKLIVCPYDKAHEIRKGRMQFHLEKCRRNFPMSQLVDCPYNKAHIVPKQELEYHMEEECESRVTWDRFTHETANVDCPVKDLVPVNAATVPDGEENWDNFEASGSVLEHIRAEAESKPILRLCQVASKAQRKKFRQNERLRMSEIQETQRKQELSEKAMSDTASVISSLEPLPRPKRQPNFPIAKQDPTVAMATISKQFRTLDLNMKPQSGSVAPSDTSSLVNGPPSEFETASTSRQPRFSYAAASQAGVSRPSSIISDQSGGTGSTSMVTALTTQRANDASRPTTAMSDYTSFASASQGLPSRPPSVMSDAASVSSIAVSGVCGLPNNVSIRPPSSVAALSPNRVRPPNAMGRPSTAMSIAASAASFNRTPTTDEDGFCQVPIPGLGRGKRKPAQ